MFLNNVLNFSQKILKKIYNSSFVLKNLDYLVAINIFLVIYSSIFMQSDSIGSFAFFGIILTVIKFLVTPDKKVKFTKAEYILLIYLMTVIISVAGSTLFLLSLKGFCKTLIYLGYYVTVVDFLSKNKKMILYVLYSFAFVGLIESFFAIQQNFLSVGEISGWQDTTRLNPEEIMTRVYGTLKPYNPNLFGGYMLSIFPATLLFTFINLHEGSLKRGLIGVIVPVFVITAILMTGCRGAYVSLFMELLLLAILSYKFLKPVYKKMYVSILSFMAFLSCCCLMAITSLRLRIVSIFAMRGDTSNSFRFNVYHSCINMFKDNWILGIGVGNQNFREIYGLYMRTGFDALSSYNIYLETALESGIIALVSFVTFVVMHLISAIKYILKKTNKNSIYLLLAVLSIAGMLVHGFVDTVFFRPQLQFVFWTMIAIIRVIMTGHGRLLNKKRSFND